MNLKKLIIPFIVSLALTIVAFFLFDLIFPKYEILTLFSEPFYNNQRRQLYFEDLDGDRVAEIIIARENVSGNSSYIVKSLSGETIIQNNLPGRYLGTSDIQFSDFNRNGFKEIGSWFSRNDSLFHSFWEFSRPEESIRKNFVDHVHFENENPDFEVRPATEVDLDIDTFNEVLFMVSGYFAAKPRKVFAYNPKKNSLLSSPELHVKPGFVEVIRSTDGESPELLFESHPSRNDVNPLYEIDDSKPWIFILNSRLELTHKRFSGAHENIRLRPIKINNKILALERTMDQSIGDSLIVFDSDLQPISRKLIPSSITIKKKPGQSAIGRHGWILLQAR